MISSRTLTVLLILIPISCCGQSSRKRPEMVGGCKVDTIRAGLAMTRKAPDPKNAYRLTVKSTGKISTDDLAACAEDLTAVLDSIGIGIASRSGIIHIVEGPCWPKYSVVFRPDNANIGDFDRIRQVLMERPVRGHGAQAERPEGYGLFFITAGSGSSDLWTVWYRDRP